MIRLPLSPREIMRLTGRALGIGVLDLVSISPVAPAGWLLRRIQSRRMRAIAEAFDVAFYLSQIRSPTRRRRARRDPLAHYAVVGWREHRAPNLHFEPRFYREDVQAGAIRSDPFWHFLRTQPPGAPRNEVEACRPAIQAPRTATRKALVFHHGRGGGSSRFLALFEADLRCKGIEPLRLRLVSQSDRLVIWSGWDEEDRIFDLLADPEAFHAAVRAAGIDIAIISHAIDFHSTFFDVIDRLVATCGLSLWMILHDYFSLCARGNLVDADGRPCPGRDSASCVRCVADAGGEVAAGDPAMWRARALGMLDRAERVLVPSRDMRVRMARFTSAPIEIWSPQADIGLPAPLRRHLAADETFRIAVIGSLNVIKGSEVVLRLASAIRTADAAMSVTLIGEAENGRRLRAERVTVLGRYREDDLQGIIHDQRPHVVFLPAICPETWSFVLSSALAEGVPVVAFAHGAPYERLLALNAADLVMPLRLIEDPAAVFAFFEGIATTWRERVRQP